MNAHENTDAGSSASAPGPVCPQCEADSLVAQRCKRICRCCGYVESCEDLFLPTYYANRVERTSTSR